MADLAELGIKVNSNQVEQASRRLDRFDREAKEAGQAAQRYEQGAKGASRAADRLQRNLDATNAQAERHERALGGVAAVARRLGPLLATVVTVETARRFLNAADAATQLENRLRLVTDGTAQLAQRQRELLELSERTRSDIQSTTNLYVRLEQALRGTGTTTREVKDVTEAFQAALAISGANATEAAAATQQFSQAIAGSTVRAEEFNSLIDASPRLIRTLINELEGVKNVGALRQLLEEGELTRDRVLRALTSALPRLREELEKTERTGGDAFTRLGNEALVLVGNINDAVGATDALKFVVDALADTAEDLNRAFEPKQGAAKLLELIRETQSELENARKAAGNDLLGLGGGNEERVKNLEERLFNLREAYLAATAGANTATKAQKAFEDATSDLVLDALEPANDEAGKLAVNYADLRKRMEATTPALDRHRAVLEDQVNATRALNVDYDDLRRRMEAATPAVEAHAKVLKGTAERANEAEERTRKLGSQVEETSGLIEGATEDAGRAIQERLAA